METTYRDLTAFLVRLGTDEVAHTERNFLAHLVGVYHDLKKWGCPEDVCRAGMFHSIYGTERFRRFALPLERRDEVRALIGARAEWIAFVNCEMDRASFDREAERDEGPYRVLDRSGVVMEMSPEDFDDLCRVHLCDWLEQVPHSKQWDYRRAAYRRLVERLGGVAREAYERTFALELQNQPRA